MLEREAKVNKTGWKELSSLLGNLPLENCTRECNPVTKEWGWKAPKNKAFRISEQFIIYSDQLNVEDQSIPEESEDLLKEEHAAIFQEFLKETGGNEMEAMKLLVEDVHDGIFSGTTPPRLFHGKWLVISPDLKEGSSPKDGLLSPKLMIKADVMSWHDRGSYSQVIEDIVPQSKTITSCMFESIKGFVRWRQYYAEAVLGKCKIELIDLPEEGVGFFVPKPVDNQQLFLPEGARGKEVYSRNDFFSLTEKRTGDEEKKRIKDFVQDTGLVFDESLDSDLLVAQRTREIILPEKKNPRDRLIKPQIVNRKP